MILFVEDSKLSLPTSGLQLNCNPEIVARQLFT